MGLIELGRNVGLKVGVPTQKENKAPWVPRRDGRRMGRMKYPLPSDSEVQDSVVSSPR